MKSFLKGLFLAKLQVYRLDKNLLNIPQAKSLNQGLSNFVYQGSIIWNFIPDSGKELRLFKHF